MTLPPDAPDAWVKLTAHGILHFVPAGERTTSCGIPAHNAVMGHTAAAVTSWRDTERPKRCAPCLRAARPLGHK